MDIASQTVMTLATLVDIIMTLLVLAQVTMSVPLDSVMKTIACHLAILLKVWVTIKITAIAHQIHNAYLEIVTPLQILANLHAINIILMVNT
jgi:hypothetical protein